MRRRVLGVLCLTEITSWGVLYYAFPVLAPSIAGDTGWPVSAVTATFSADLVCRPRAGGCSDAGGRRDGDVNTD